jgi:hypothetical protein
MNEIGLIGKKLVELTSTKKERSLLDTNYHYVPVNLEVLNITLSAVIVQNVEDIYDADTIELAKQSGIDLSKDSVISLQELKDKISKFIKSKHKNTINITSQGILVNNSPTEISELRKYLPATVISNGDVVGALYAGYDPAYDGLFKSFLNTEISKFLKKTLYEGTNYKVGFDVGHIFGDSELTRTPLGQKLKKLYAALSSITDGLDFEGIDPNYLKQNKQGVTDIKIKVEQALQKLAENSSYGKQVDAVLTKDLDLKNFLLSISANVIVIQDRFENQAVYAKLLEGPLGREIIELLKTINFSRNLIQEIEYGIVNTLTKQPITSTKASQKLPRLTVSSDIKPNISLDTTSYTKVNITESGKTFKAKSVNLQGLSTLQNLINAKLADQIKQNMGTGNSKNILNLRTGRFAESVKVERMSQSREGMITAFYSYMRNPYATFSTGGRQEYPRSRDPKLLISKSIREIAETKVKNRLRAVLV